MIDLSQAIASELTKYSETITKNVNAKSKKAMSNLVKKSKATAPVGRRSKHYKDSIKSRTKLATQSGTIYEWYVAGSNYRLTHLLNNGHALKDGGRYEGTNFLTKAVEEIEKDYIKEVEDVIKNG